MPLVTPHREQWTTMHNDVIVAEDLPLFLPSSLSSDISCSTTAQEYEWRLRVAQAHDTLESLRSHLCLRTHMFKFKDRFITGQRQNTRARSTIGHIEGKINNDITRYHAAHAALSALGPILGKQDWNQELQVLNRADVRGISQGTEGSTEGTRQLSWIWVMQGAGMNAEQKMQNGTFSIISIFV